MRVNSEGLYIASILWLKGRLSLKPKPICGFRGSALVHGLGCWVERFLEAREYYLTESNAEA